jgi:cytochrome c551
MRTAKLLSIMAAFALFVIACNSSTSTNTTTNTTANTTNTAQQPVNTNPAQTKPSPTDEMTSVRAIYAAECARCHGTSGDGGPVTVLKKKMNVPSLKKGHALDHTEEELAKQIRDGGDGMPAFKDQLKAEEITGLVKLIRQDFQGGAAKK